MRLRSFFPFRASQSTSLVLRKGLGALWFGAAVASVLLAACCRPPSPPTLPALAATPGPGGSPVPVPPRPQWPTAAPGDLYLAAEDIYVYPGPTLYSGDVLSFDLIPRNLGQIDPAQLTVRIYRRSTAGMVVIAEGTVGYPGFDGLPRARLTWAWDTDGAVGEPSLVAWLDPDDLVQRGDEDPGNNRVPFTVDLRPAAERPPLEESTTWVTTTTPCCVLHYLSGTSAERDMPGLRLAVQENVSAVAGQLGITLTGPLDLYFVGRVVGQGGYAYEAVVVSYLDRHYAGFDLATVIRHETVHVLDAAYVSAYPPPLLREGLAVWAAGGHYKPEPIPRRAAGLVQLDRYVPLAVLADDFHAQQHEIGYLEAGALVAYLVETHGWERFRRFYGSFDRYSGPPGEVIDSALAGHFGRGLVETEGDFQAWLEAHPAGPAELRDLQETLYLLDTVRRYQIVHDRNAHWLQAWLPDPAEGESKQIEADFLRHPSGRESVALEAMLIAAREAMVAGQFDRAEALIDAVNRVLDRGTFAGRPEADFLAVVEAVTAAGYEPQQVELDGEVARVRAIAVWPHLELLTLRRSDGAWRLE